MILTSTRKKLTVFFPDIVDFTPTTDRMESEDLTQLLDHYLSEMTDIALRFGATVDKYLGDAIMIFFGDPKSHGVRKDAQLCVEMALAMQERLVALREAWKRQGITEGFPVRMGIRTGYCTVGNFGTESRMDYTIVGSAANLASRIESNAEPNTVYVSEATQLLERERFQCLPAKTVTPKGFPDPVQLYRVLPQGQSRAVEELELRGARLAIQFAALTPESRQALRAHLRRLLEEIEGRQDPSSRGLSR